MKNKQSLGVYCSAMLIFGTIGIVVKQLPFSSPMIACLRTSIGAIVLGVVLLCMRKKPKRIKGEGRYIVLSALFLGCNWIFLFEGYRYTSVANATMIYYMAPMFIVAYAICVDHLKISKQMIISFVCTILGFCMITIQASAIHITGSFYALLSAFAYAGVVLINREIHMEALPFTFVQLMLAAVLLGCYTIVTQEDHLGTLLSSSTLPWILTIGILHTGIAYALYFSSIATLAPSKVAVFSYLDPAIAILCSYFILQDSMSTLQWFGILAIAIGLLSTPNGRDVDVL